MTQNEHQRLSYYLKAFLIIYQRISNNLDCISLLNDAERNFLYSFGYSLSEDSQKLILRLLMRSTKVFKLKKIEYNDIKDVVKSYNQLTGENWLIPLTVDSEVDLILDSLTANELKIISQSYLHIDGKGKSLKQLRQMLKSKSPSQRTFSKSGELKQAKTREQLAVEIEKVVGKLFVINEDAIGFYGHLSLIFFGDHDQSMETLVLATINRLSFPKLEQIHFTAKQFFSSMEMMHSYERYHRLMEFVASEVEGFPVNESVRLSIDEQVKAEARSVVDDHLDFVKMWQSDFCPANKTLSPLSIEDQVKAVIGSNRQVASSDNYIWRRYHPGWPVTKTIQYLARNLQRKKEFSSASTLYLNLLTQLEYCVGSRGGWWTRLIMHEKNKELAKNYCEIALSDPFVRSGCRWGLQKRLDQLNNTLTERKRKRTSHFDGLDIITIYGEMMGSRRSGAKSAFKGEDGTSLTVEDYSLQQYGKLGWKGIHSEGSLMRTLFGIFFWDIIFDTKVPMAFIHEFQSAPLDFASDYFYDARKNSIEERLQLIRESNAVTLIDMFLSVYKSENFGTAAVGISWDLIPLTDFIEVVISIGGACLSKIFQYFAEDYRSYVKGFPDLFLWKVEGPFYESILKRYKFTEDDDVDESEPESSDQNNLNESEILGKANSALFKFVEVKGPNDRLSDAQNNWREILSELSIGDQRTMEICRVLEKESDEDVISDCISEEDNEVQVID